MKIEQLEDIEAWQLARELTCKIYRLTERQGFEKDYGLKRQIAEPLNREPLNPAT